MTDLRLRRTGENFGGKGLGGGGKRLRTGRNGRGRIAPHRQPSKSPPRANHDCYGKKTLDDLSCIGHIMTIMSIPNPNDPKSIEAHKLRVLAEFGPLFELIDSALGDSVLKAKDTFLLLDGPVDLSVHASLTRYLCKQFLASQNVSAEEEDASDFEIERISNCGLCLNQGTTQVRILKATTTGIPKAASEARSRFYSSNQLLLELDWQRPESTWVQPPLSLVVLWELADGFSYGGMQIACPRGERRDGNVDCYWIVAWDRGAAGTMAPRQGSPMAPDLDEIKPVRERKKASS